MTIREFASHHQLLISFEIINYGRQQNLFSCPRLFMIAWNRRFLGDNSFWNLFIWNWTSIHLIRERENEESAPHSCRHHECMQHQSMLSERESQKIPERPRNGSWETALKVTPMLIIASFNLIWMIQRFWSRQFLKPSTSTNGNDEQTAVPTSISFCNLQRLSARSKCEDKEGDSIVGHIEAPYYLWLQCWTNSWPLPGWVRLVLGHDYNPWGMETCRDSIPPPLAIEVFGLNAFQDQVSTN